MSWPTTTDDLAVANQVTTAYVDECLEQSSSLRRAAADVVLPPTYSQSYGKLMLSRPLFVDHDEITGFADDLTALFDFADVVAREDLRRGSATVLRSAGHGRAVGRADAVGCHRPP